MFWKTQEKYLQKCLYCFIALTLFLQSSTICAQFPDIPEGKLFNIEDGISQSRVTVVFVDSYGFIWVGTNDGLNRYDGYTFKTYRHQPFDSTSISNNYIRCIQEDNNHNIWVGTNDGLSCLNRETEKFKQYNHSESDSSTIRSQAVSALFFDNDNVLWLKTESYLERFDQDSGFFIAYKHYYDPKTPGILNSSNILEDINGFLWFGTKDGLFSFNRESGAIKHYFNDPLNPLSLSNNQVRALYEDKNGVLWIASSEGLNKYDRIHKTFRQYSPNRNSGVSFFDIVEDKDGVFWITASNGLYLFNKRTSQFRFIEKLTLNKSDIKLSTLFSIAKDHSDILWVGGFKGLIKIDLKPKKFNLYKSSDNSSLSLGGDNISALYKDIYNKVWVGIWNQGIDILDRRKGNIEHYSSNAADNKYRIPDDKVRCFFEDKKNVWIGTSNGVFIYHRQSGLFYDLNEYLKGFGKDELKGRMVFDIAGDRRSNIWFATDKGIYMYNSKSKMLQSFNQIYNNATSTNIDRVYALAVDDKDHLWVGTNNGLIEYDIVGNIFYLFEKRQGQNGLPDRFINSLCVNRDNNLWIGTPSGLIFYDRKKETMRTFTEKDGLPNNFIYAIVEDSSGFIWLSTNKGISRYSPNNNIFTNYGISDGIQSFEFNLGAGYIAKDNEIFFGGINGFNSFYPTKLPVNPHVPDVKITYCSSFDEDGVNKIYYGDTLINISLPYHESLTIEYAALDFTFPENNRYKYSLQEKGKNPAWISVGNNRSLTFSNLTQGEYVFRVLGSNNDNVWNDEGAVVNIEVKAPFWKARFAYFVYLIFGLSFMFYIIQFRTKSLRRSNKILREREITAKRVEIQRNLLVKRNKNIEDSLNYAQRIQKAMLPTPKTFKTILPDSFILHKPKDIVSGDFYWISKVKDNIFVAAVDCTGHGVPGAFMSVIGFELFRKIINMQHIYDPSRILHALNDNMEDIFGNPDDITLRDGMDLAF